MANLSSKTRSRPRWTFCLVIVILIVFASCGAVALIIPRLQQSIGSVLSSGGLPVQIDAVPGDPSHFDPIASYDSVHKFAGSTLDLDTIIATYVRSDGTLDLSAPYDPNVDYRFFEELSTQPPSAPPLGVRGVTDQKWDNQVEVLIQPKRMISIGGAVQGLHAATAPKCALKTLWSAALEKGAPSDAVAKIIYNVAGYNFSIRNTKIDLDFDTDCRLKTK
ncbi:MAG: hypothetical protein ABI947_27900 [Chloroflexota bacterium]